MEQGQNDTTMHRGRQRAISMKFTFTGLYHGLSMLDNNWIALNFINTDGTYQRAMLAT